MVFFFHCARFFGGGGWHLKNPGEESLIATLFIGLLDLWIMPLFFLISGAAMAAFRIPSPAVPLAPKIAMVSRLAGRPSNTAIESSRSARLTAPKR